MIIKFRVVRKDTKAPVVGAKVVLEHGNSDGITNSAGEAEIVTYYSGNLLFSVEASGYEKTSGTVQAPSSGTIIRGVELGAYAAPPIPPPSGEEIVGNVGPSCDLLVKYMFGRRWHSYRQRYTGGRGHWVDESDIARRNAEADASCFALPPPPPKSAEDVQKDVDILRGTLQGISSRVQDLVTSLTEMGKALSAVQASIPGMIQAAMESALAPVYASIDALKAWIIDNVLDLVWGALTREKKVS